MLRTPRSLGRILFSPRDRGPTGSRRSSHGRAARPQLEALEDRALLSTTFPVTLISDSPTPQPGELRYEINAAEAAGDGKIIFQLPSHSTITLTQGELPITTNLDIEGPGACRLTISGGHNSRIFDIGPNDTNVTIAGLTIADGLANAQSPNPFNFSPTPSSEGGGILNLGTLKLSNDVLWNNQAVGATNVIGAGFSGGARGGGVSNLGTLTVDGCQFIHNRAQGANDSSGPAAAGFGGAGAIANTGIDDRSTPVSARINDSLFVDNVAQGGNGNSGPFAGLGYSGAIVNSSILDVTSCTFLHNKALGGNNNSGPVITGAGVGGAIGSGRGSLRGLQSVKVSGSTFDYNLAVGGNGNTVTTPALPLAYGPNNGSGGAIQINKGSGEITDSTFLHNLALGGQGAAHGGAAVGGGIVASATLDSTVKVTVSNSTVDHNAAIGGQGGPGGDGGAGLGGGFFASGGLGNALRTATLEVSSTTVNHNLALGGEGGDGGNGGNGYGGGLYNAGGPATGPSTLTLTGATVKHNFALGGKAGSGGSDGQGIGGGVYALGTFTFDSPTVIKKNHASTSNDDIFSQQP